jgi:tight adherence protein B
MRVFRRAGLVAFAALLAVAAANAATPTPTQTSAPTVVEAGGAAYPDKAYILTLPVAKRLTNGDVTLTENGSRVPGANVSQEGVGGGGTAVVLAIDASGSMTGEPIKDAVAAAQAYVDHLVPNEKVAIVTFNDGVHVIQDFTDDPQQIAKALETAPKLAVGTKINDALDQSVNMLSKTGASNAAIVLLSDGTDVGSKLTRADVLDELKGSNVRVFSVGLASDTFNKKGLEKLASTTGGDFVQATGPSQLAPIFTALAQRLAREYVVTYKTRANPSQKVTVVFDVKGLPPATTSYTAPQLHLVPVKPYSPSSTERVIQSTYTLIAVALVAALLLGYAVMRAFAPRPDPIVDRVGDFVSVQRDPIVKAQQAASAGQSRRQAFITRMTERRESGWSTRLADTFELAGIEAEPSHVIILTALATVMLVFLLGLLFGWIGVVVGLTVPLLARFLIRRRVSKTRKAFAEQLPDNLDVLASALRAGHSLVSAMTVVAADAGEPSRKEFRRVLTDEQFGVQLEDALKTTVERMENEDLEQVALVARLQREMGSNSAEVLDRVIETVRGRMELRRLVSSLTAQGRFSRWVLTVLPLGLAIVLTLISPLYMHPLFHTLAGQLLLVVAAVCVAIGSWMIGKIVDIRI